METFGQRLRELRNKRGISQNELSKHIGVSKSSVNMYERGEREPNFETLEAIADFFNVNMDYLLGRESIDDTISRINYNNLGIDRLSNPAKLLYSRLLCALLNTLDSDTPGDSSDIKQIYEEIRNTFTLSEMKAMFEMTRTLCDIIAIVARKAGVDDDDLI